MSEIIVAYPPGGAGGGVTSVSSANTDISITSPTTTPVFTLNSGTGNNQIVKLNGSSQLPAVDGSLLTGVSATASTVLSMQGTSGAITGTGSTQTIFTYSMPSGTMGASDGVRIRVRFALGSAPSANTNTILFGATTIMTRTISTAQTYLYEAIVMNTGITTAQTGIPMFEQGGSTTSAAQPTTSPAENTNSGSPIIIKVTFNSTNAGTATPVFFLVEKLH